MEIEYIAIKNVVNEYEKKRKKSQLLGVITGIICIIIAILILWKGDIKINLYSCAPLFGAFAGIQFRMGSKKENKYMEEVKFIIENTIE